MAAINIFGPADGVPFEVVSGIINITGRNIVFHATSGYITCQTCNGSDPFCEVCRGNMRVEQLYSVDAIASVRWRPAENKIYKTTGQTISGDCLVVVAITDTIEDVLRHTTYVDVDQRRCVIDSWYRKGAPVNRVEIVLKEDQDLVGPRIG